MGSKSKTLNDLALHQLRDLHHAERHGGKMLGKLAKAASDEALKRTLEDCSRLAQMQLDRLDATLEQLGKKAHAEPCAAMGGLIDEAKALLHDFDGSEALDAGLLAAAQAMLHYTLARSSAVADWSARLGLPAAAALTSTIGEKRELLGRLDRLAGGGLGQTAAVTEAPAQALTLKLAALAGLR